ncbi:hypothetical protein [Streptomyces sp. NPDC007205]|uniref:hypothetical protein n=1 Tax=Streptomyces sp. NPDC007205 TaxID=3154316 RepID=UPI003411993C
MLLAHERAHLAHLAHRNDRYRALGEMACALNPLLRGLRDQLGFALERWTDKDAAQQVASRPLAARFLALAARSLTLAALAGPGGGPAVALAYLRHQVTARVRVLQGTRPESRRSATLLATSLVTLTAFAMADTTSAPGRFLATLHP